MRVKFTLKEEPEPFEEVDITHSLNLNLNPPVSENQKRKAVAKKLWLRKKEVKIQE